MDPFSPPPTRAQASFHRAFGAAGGSVSIALAPLHEPEIVVFGADAATPGWSTTKVPVLLALLRARGPDGLTAAERRWAHLAITESDNQAILDLFGSLQALTGGLQPASQRVQELFRSSGDRRTMLATDPPPPGAFTTFGQTRWSPGDSAMFFRALGRGELSSPADTQFVLDLMRNVVPAQRWGLGDAGFSGSPAFKGGWGPDQPGCEVRQSGLVEAGPSAVTAVSIVTRSPSLADGTQLVTRAARWLRAELAG